MRNGFWVLLFTLGHLVPTMAQAMPRLQLQGEPYFGGSVELTVVDTTAIGQPALLAFGLNPLSAPVQSAKGSWYIGTLINLIALGNVPATGLIDLHFALPAVMPSLVGVPVVMQGYVPSRLSNPAVLRLDSPYFLPSNAVQLSSPQPQIQALFGDRVASADLNADGVTDLVVGAWFQDVAGFEKAGSTFILWGPNYDSHAVLEPAAPRENGNFGESLTVADFDRDGVDDLLVGESAGSPTPPGAVGWLHLYWGGARFATASGLDIVSGGSGPEYGNFGREVVQADFDADGWPDVAAKIDHATVAGQAQAGRVDVYWGPVFSTRTEIISPDNGDHAYFGSFLAAADVNGDGISDLIESSGRDDVGGTVNLGSAHIFAGPDLHWEKTISAPVNNGLNTRFGESLDVIEDTDGTARIVIGDLAHHVFIFDTAWDAPSVVINEPPIEGVIPTGATFFSEIHVPVADVNGDGGPDILIPNGTGVLDGCGLLGPEGELFVALHPYYSTFFKVNEPVPNCGDGFTTSSLLIGSVASGTQQLVVSAPTVDLSSAQNAGVVWLFH